jgi:hypothetical protein
MQKAFSLDVQKAKYATPDADPWMLVLVAASPEGKQTMLQAWI